MTDSVTRLVRISRVPDPARVADGAARLLAPGTQEPHVLGIAIDVLRATSSLTVAGAAGAAGILPFAHTEQAIAWRDAHPDALACGERDGAIVPGFDLGNSPFEYTAARVSGRTLAFASTNGSRAMLALHGCGTRRLAAFVNASAALREAESAANVHIVCAGERGRPSAEDLACAAWLAQRLLARGFTAADVPTESFAGTAPATRDDIAALVHAAPHGRALSALGPDYQRDVDFCATLDALDVCIGW